MGPLSCRTFCVPSTSRSFSSGQFPLVIVPTLWLVSLFFCSRSVQAAPNSCLLPAESADGQSSGTRAALGDPSKCDPSRGWKLLPSNLMCCFAVGFAVVITGICFSVSMMGNFWVHCFTSGKVNMKIIFQLVFSAWTVLHKFSCVPCDDSNTAGVSGVCLKLGAS